MLFMMPASVQVSPSAKHLADHQGPGNGSVLAGAKKRANCPEACPPHHQYCNHQEQRGEKSGIVIARAGRRHDEVQGQPQQKCGKGSPGNDQDEMKMLVP